MSKKQTVRVKAPFIGRGICDACGREVPQLMTMDQQGDYERGITGIAGLCACQECAGDAWPKTTRKRRALARIARLAQ